MGQKVNPIGLRIGVIKDWETKWFANKQDFSKFLIEDYNIRKHIKKKYYDCGISQVIIERTSTRLTVTIETLKPGVLIGKGGAGIDVIKKELATFTKANKQVYVNILEIKVPDLNAQILSERAALQLEKRGSWRRAMRSVMQSAMKAGAKGVKVNVSGRLDGAEIARSEHYKEGSTPLHTLRANIDYGFAEALTGFGIIGVKVWIYKGEILEKPKANLGGGKNEGGK